MQEREGGGVDSTEQNKGAHAMRVGGVQKNPGGNGKVQGTEGVRGGGIKRKKVNTCFEVGDGVGTKF